MTKILKIAFAVGFIIMGIAAVVFFPKQNSVTVKIETSGTIVYPKTAANTQEPSSFSLPQQPNGFSLPFKPSFAILLCPKKMT